MMRRLSGALLVLGLLNTVTVHAQQPHLNVEDGLRVCNGTVTDECVTRYFKETHEASVIRGRLVFQHYCVLCHGQEGKGDGRAAKLHTPPPFNLTRSVAPLTYIEQMIRNGGTAMNRGKGMPPWGEQLTDEQIQDTLNYLYSIREFK